LRSELISSHVRSLMEAHLTDVASSERHTVRPWFTGKLDYAPPVFDFASAGFPLVGGRLDYIGKRRVAALVYRAGLHTVNVFIWPDAAGTNEDLALNGFNISRLNAAGMQFWAVSDLEMGQLDKLIGLIGAQLTH
jgi:anti-sigma factor RsiW